MNVQGGESDGQDERANLGALDDLADGEMRGFADVGEFGIVVCRVAGTLHAVVDNCSHADTPLSEGRLRGSTITCPLHGAQFDVRDGSHKGPPAFEGVQVYRIDETNGGVVVTIRSSPDDVDRDQYGQVGGRFRTR